MKAHIFCSDVPAPGRFDRRAMCGEIVPCAVWVYHFNTGQNKEFLSALSAINTCAKCFREPLPDGYVYGMVSAYEIEQDEADVA